MKTIIIFSFTFLILMVNLSFAQIPNWVWAKSCDENSRAVGEGVTVDCSGNVYAIGFFNSPTITFDTITLINENAYQSDIFIVKYDNLGGILWAKRAGGGDTDYAYSIVVDSLGNFYIRGVFYSSTISFDSYVLLNNAPINSSSSFIVKYDTFGNVLWAKSTLAGCSGMSIDKIGNFYLTGSFTDTIIFDSYTLFNNGPYNYTDIFLVKYDSSGNVIWAKSAGGTNWENSYSISVDFLGYIYITGSFNSSIIAFDSLMLINETVGTSDIFVTKYNSLGSPVWAKRAGSSRNDIGRSIKVDAIGNVFVTGEFYGTYITFGTNILLSANYYQDAADIFILKLDSSGNILWANNAGGDVSDYSYSISVDELGNSFVAGRFNSFNVFFNNSTILNADTVGHSYDIFVAKYNASGILVWVKSVGGLNDDGCFSMCVDLSGNAYLAGYFESQICNFGDISLTNSIMYSSKFFVAKLDNITNFDFMGFEPNDFNIYPNPTNTTMLIKINSENIQEIKIYNIIGQLLYQSKILKNKIIVTSNLSSGVYVIKLITEKSILSKNFIKN